MGGGGGGGGGGAVRFQPMGGDRCQNSRPPFNDFWGGGGGGRVVKCCRLLHKTITTSIHINLYSSLYSIPLAIIIPESVSPNYMMAAAARGSVINALVPTQDGRSVSSDQMDAFIPTIELAYREILLIKHTEGLNVNEKSTKQYIRMALNVHVLRDRGYGHCKTCSFHRQKRVEPLGGRDFLYLETISNISWKTVLLSLKLPK